jgi:hypothetical protein
LSTSANRRHDLRGRGGPKRGGSAAPDPDHGIGLGINDDVQAVAAKLRRRGLAAPQGLDEARVGGGLRLLAKRLGIGLAENRLRRLGLAGVGPRSGASEVHPHGGGSKRDESAAGVQP